MPSTYGATDAQMKRVAAAGKLDLVELDACVRRLLEYVDRAAETLSRGAAKWDVDAHHEVARQAAAEGIVLLKNDAAALPLQASAQSIAVIGEFAAAPRYQGGGSSFVNATRTSSALAELQKASSTVQYAAGYSLAGGERDAALAALAVDLAARSDAAVLFIGLTEEEESEGFDRAHMRLPAHHNALVDAVAAVNKRTIVVLTNASAVEMPWADKVQAIVEAYLPGQAGAAAVADVLLGTVNPSGKLSESFPLSLKHNPPYLNFPGKYEVTYAERIYVGYRYYDTVDMPVLFPFGHGLSYTTFGYSAPRVLKAAYVDNENVEAEVTLTNTGALAGAEVVQLYVRDVASGVDRPDKELKAFEKVHLAPGESKTVRFSLDRRAFAYYDVARKDWVVEAGDFELLFGSSSRDLRGSATVAVTPATAPPVPVFDKNTMIGDVCAYPATQCFSKILLRDFSGSTMDPSFIRMFQTMEGMLPVRCMVINTNGALNHDDVAALIAEANKMARTQGK